MNESNLAARVCVSIREMPLRQGYLVPRIVSANNIEKWNWRLGFAGRGSPTQ
jgi:hypothetical protein